MHHDIQLFIRNDRKMHVKSSSHLEAIPFLSIFFIFFFFYDELRSSKVYRSRRVLGTIPTRHDSSLSKSYIPLDHKNYSLNDCSIR